MNPLTWFTLRRSLTRGRSFAPGAWPAGSVAAFLELHIEQGLVLEAEAATIGIVDAITGRVVVDTGDATQW